MKAGQHRRTYRREFVRGSKCEQDVQELKNEIKELKNMLRKSYTSKSKQMSHVTQYHKHTCAVGENYKPRVGSSKKALEKARSKKIVRDMGMKVQKHSRRNNSVAFMKFHKPLFTKVNPIVCQEEEEDISIQSVTFYQSKTNVLLEPVDRKSHNQNFRQSNSSGITSTLPNTPKKWNSAFKKVKCDMLGYYLDRATNIISSSNYNSGKSSSANSFKEIVSANISYEKNDPGAYKTRSSMKEDRASFLSTRRTQALRNSMTNLPKNPNLNTPIQKPSVNINPFVVSKSNYLDNCYEMRGRNHTNSQMNAISNHDRNYFKIAEIKNKNDDEEASELKKFIEVEDYCRRTTTPNNKKEVKIPTIKKMKKVQESQYLKVPEAPLVSSIKSKKKRNNDKGPYLVKTFSITICGDDQIMYN